MRFSDFLLVSDPGDLEFIVGYTEDENIRINVSDFFGNQIFGSGNPGYIPVFTGTQTLGNSQIFQDGANIVIGGVNASGYRLAVGGSLYTANGAVINSTVSGADALRVIGGDGDIFVIPNDLGQSISSLRRIIHPPAVLTTESATLGQVNSAILNLENDIDILLDLKVDKTSIGVPNGVASLDSGGKVPLSQIPDSIIGQVQYMGTWNAFTNTPTLNPLVPEEKGHYYVVSAAGVFGGVDYQIGDWIISNGVIWEKVDNTDAVTSVFGRIGAILALEGDYQAFYPRLSQAYDNPTWINTLAFTKITGVPPFLLENQTITLSGDVTGSGKTSISTTISNNAVSNEKLRDSIGTSVIGRSASTTGDPADIQATTDGHVLLRSAGNLLFGLISGDSISSINWSKITGTPTTLSGYGITDAYTKTEADNKFVPYTGANANVNLGSNNITANSFIKAGGTSSQFLKADGSVDTSQYVPTTRSVNAGTGLTGGGNLSSDITIAFDTTWGDNRYAYRTRQLTINGVTYDLSADRTWSVGTVNTLTTIGTSGPATLVGNTLNIPQYTDQFVGTVTSVGLSMPNAFTVSNSPITSAGTLTVVGAGTAAQYVRGDGSLGDFPSGGGGGGSSVSYYLNGSINQGTFAGNTYYEMSKIPVFGAGTDFNIATNGYVAQFITDANDPESLLIPAGNWNFEVYFSASSAGGTPSFYVELYKYDGTTFTLIADNSANPEFIAFGTIVSPYFSPLAVPETVLAVTDRLAIRVYVNNSGKTITLHTENSNLCQVITTFTTGLTALNGLTKQVQYFTTGTSGTDFNIASSVATHTFNLPTASAVNRGALSAADWAVFNGKQNAITLTTTGTTGAATLIGSTLNIPNYTTDLSGYVPYTGATQAVNLGYNQLLASTLSINGDSLTAGSYLGFKHSTNVTTGSNGYTSIYTFGTNLIGFKSISGATTKEFSFSMVGITPGVPGGRVYNMPDADGTIALLSDIPSLAGYVTLDTTQTITGLKTILRGGDVLNFKIGTDTLYGLKIAYNQNELVPSGEATWSFVNTFNNGSGTGLTTTPISFFRGVLVTGERLLSASVNTNLLNYYASNPSGRYPIYAYNTGVQQFASSIIVGETNGVVDAITGAIADLPAGVVANFKGRVIGSNAVNNNEFATLGQVTSTSRAAISLTTTGTSGPATYSSVTGVLNIPEYQGGVTSFNTRTGAVTLTSLDVTTALGYTPVTDARTLSINGVTYDLTANRSWTVGVNPSAREIQTYIATASQTTFTVTGGYTVGLVDVFINGVRLTSSDYTATNGTTVVLTVGTMAGNIVDIIKYTSGFTNPIAGTLATGQVAFGTAANTVGGDNGLFWDNTNKRLGIGTASPAAPLTVQGASSDGVAIFRDTTSLNVGTGGSIRFEGQTTTGGGFTTGLGVIIGGKENATSGNTSSYIAFQTRINLQALTERWRITSTGILQSNGAQTIQTSTGALTLQPSNNVLIGTTTDAGFKLDVNGTGRFSSTGNALRIASTSTASNVQLYITNNNNGDVYTGVAASDGSSVFTGTTAYSGYIGTNLNVPFYIAAGGTTRVTVTSSGNVGIGTTSPSFALDVSNKFAVDTSNAFGRIYLQRQSGTSLTSMYIQGANQNNTANILSIVNSSGIAGSAIEIGSGNIIFYNNNQTSERMRITSGGNVGIGTTSPVYKIHVVGENFNQAILDNTGQQYTGLDFRNNGTTKTDFYYDNTNTAFNIRTRVAGPLILSTTDTERMRITSGGNVLIGTTTDAGFKLDVSGTGRFIGPNASGRGQLSIQSNNASNAARASWYYDTVLQGNIGTTSGDFYVEAVNNLSLLGTKIIVGSTSGSNLALGTKTKHYIVGDGSINAAASHGSMFVAAGTTLGDTGISVNQSTSGMTMILIASINTSTGTSTNSAVYIVRFYFSGNNTPTATYIGGSSDFVTFGQSGSNTLTISGSSAGNKSYAWFVNKYGDS